MSKRERLYPEIRRLREDEGLKWRELFYLSNEVTPGVVYQLVVWREQVCTRVVTGTREVEEPDPEAVAALPLVTRTVDEVEWRCEPLLAARDTPAPKRAPDLDEVPF